MSEQGAQLDPAAEGFRLRLRLRYGSSKQGRFTIRVKDEKEAIRRANLLRELAKALTRSGRRSIESEIILRSLAEASDPQEFASLLEVAGASAKKVRGKPQRSISTFAQVADEWTSGRLHQRFPDHVKTKRTAHDDEQMLRLLGKTVGDIPIDRFQLEHAERAMAALPERLSSARRRQYAQVMARVLKLAVYPLRLIAASPLPQGFLPKVKNNKGKVWLYPNEDKLLLQNRKVPLGRRVLWGFLSREGLRLGEAMALRWSDLDLERGTIMLNENKTDDPRMWALGRDVARALALYRPADFKPEDYVFPRFDDLHRAAKVLRSDLTDSGVTREELFKASKNRSMLRVHDLRGSFVTLALATGRSEAWVSDRTGHKSSAMINRYRRAARSATELGLGWHSPLDQCLPETRSERVEPAQGESQGESEGPLTGIESKPKSRKSQDKAEVAEWQTQRIQNPPP